MQETYQDYENKEESILDSVEADQYLHDWIFHYNCYTKLWSAIPKERYNDYWSDYELPGLIRSSTLSTIQHLLFLSKGDMNKLEQYIQEDESGTTLTK